MNRFKIKSQLFRLILDNRETVKKALTNDYSCTDNCSYGENLQLFAYQRLMPLFPLKFRDEIDRVIDETDWHYVASKFELMISD